MRCEVLLFAQVREAVGAGSVMLDLPDGATVGDALDSLGAMHEAIGAMRGRLAMAVNERYVQPQTVLREGDRIALIPPVSGG
jgi:molybdopterin converting factor subunit 1